MISTLFHIDPSKDTDFEKVFLTPIFQCFKFYFQVLEFRELRFAVQCSSVVCFQSAVTSACFAKFHPNLVVGGTYSGQIVLWDNRSNKRTPVQRTPLSSAAHTVRCLTSSSSVLHTIKCLHGFYFTFSSLITFL